MKINILLCLLSFVFGMIFYNKVFVTNADYKKVTQIESQIDSVFSERTNYVKDTVIPKEKIIKKNFTKAAIHIDSIFKDSSVENKQKLFDSTYPTSLYDSFKILDITSSQSHDAIEAKLLQQRDSQLLEVCTDNVNQCENTLDTLKVRIDTLKEYIPKGNGYWKTVGVVSSITVVVMLVLNFLR